MFLPYITLTAQIPAALQSHGSHYKPYILWLQADFIQKYPKCCVLPKFTKFHIHLIFPCCPPYIPPLPTARISRMGPFPDQSDAPSWLPGCTFLDRPDVPSRTDWMPLPGCPDVPSRTDPIYLPGPTPCTFPDRPHVPSRTAGSPFLRGPEIPLPGAPHPPVPSYSLMVVTISAKKVIALVALSAYYMVGLLITMRQNRKGGKLSGPYGIVSGKQGL